METKTVKRRFTKMLKLKIKQNHNVGKMKLNLKKNHKAFTKILIKGNFTFTLPWNSNLETGNFEKKRRQTVSYKNNTQKTLHS